MPAPDNRPPSARPPSRGPLISIVVLILALGLAGVFFLRRPPQGSSPGPTPATSANPTSAPTAAVREPAGTPGALPTATQPPAAPTASQPAAPVAASSPTPNDSRYHPPRLLATRPVTYPEQAFLNRVEGTVLVKFFIDEAGKQGKPPIVEKSSGSVMLDAVVLEYDLRQWTFQPATLDGKPVPGTMEREFEFHLDKAEQDAMAARRTAAKVGTPDAPYPREALALKPRGACTISVTWTKGGLVDRIVLTKASGSNILDRAALRFAYENWHIDPKDVVEGKEFSKTMTFTPPTGPNETPPPLLPPDAPVVPAATVAPPTPAR